MCVSCQGYLRLPNKWEENKYPGIERLPESWSETSRALFWREDVSQDLYPSPSFPRQLIQWLSSDLNSLNSPLPKFQTARNIDKNKNWKCIVSYRNAMSNVRRIVHVFLSLNVLVFPYLHCILPSLPLSFRLYKHLVSVGEIKKLWGHLTIPNHWDCVGCSNSRRTS